jgi:arylsulfatase
VLTAAIAILLGSASAIASAQDPTGHGIKDSPSPSWPKLKQAPAGAPNVLLILTDDVGFAASSTFGGPVPTPAFDALAKSGLRYTQYNNTALCSPTRAALLTGRNPHNVGMGAVPAAATGYPGYTGEIPRSAGTIAEVLRQNGYSTYAIGKWHIMPEWEESNSGDLSHWPTNMGFQRYFGFLTADTDQFAPSLYQDVSPVEPPHDPGYILDRDLADRAISVLKQQRAVAPSRPFFLYYATGSTHAPQQAPHEWIAKFKGKFRQGWDRMREESFARQKRQGIVPSSAILTPRPSSIPAWGSLSGEQKQLFERMMEIYAGQLAFADFQIGRVVHYLRDTGQLNNTLVIFIQGDNGASGEGGLNGSYEEQSFINRYDEPLDEMLKRKDELGGPTAYNNYPVGWAWAMNTPFQYYKQVASHLGGVRNGMVISWPDRIKDAGGIRTQFQYVTDIYPTILRAAGINAPDQLDGVRQMPIDGIDLSYTFDNAKVPSNRHIQVFEMLQNMGIYHDGWWAGTKPVTAPWDYFKSAASADPDKREWELYDLSRDFSQGRDISKENPDKLRAMQQLFWAEAQRNQILPIHSITEGAQGRPSLTAGRSLFEYDAGVTRVPASAAPDTIGHSFSIRALLDVPASGAEGMVLTEGGQFGGFALYFSRGAPIFHYNCLGKRQYTIRSDQVVSPGKHELLADFQADSAERGAGGVLTLMIDGQVAARGRIEHTLRVKNSLREGLDVGEDTVTPVNGEYRIEESKLTAVLEKVTVRIL